MSEDGESSRGFNAFWYGVLCQAADMILPAPTPFKAWLHDQMGFTDDISVLWEEEIYETDLSKTADTVQKAGSPFDLISQAAADTTGKELASEAYRQVSYVNDVTRANEQVLVEYTTDGALGNSATSYTYGVQRESYAMTRNAAAAGGVTEALISYSSGAYYYTGTGSVSNLISSGRSYAYTYAEYGARTVYRADTNVTAISDTCESYGYNGEYTHETLGIQYLRARYYSMGTGTFTSRDTYAGRIESILSQNRYTYAENNPVNYADPSGHAKKKGGLPSLQKNMWIANGGNGPAYKQPVNNPAAAAKAVYQKRREDLGLPEENTLLDNARVYNGQEYYNNLVLNTSISALMSPIGGSHTFAESIAAKVEAAMCQAYAQCKNELQEEIKNNILLSVGVVPDDSLLCLGGVVIRNGESVIIIPEIIQGKIRHNDTGEIEEILLNPRIQWAIVGKGSYKDGVQKDSNGYYMRAVGPRILNSEYPDDGGILASDYSTGQRIDLIIVNKSTGEMETLECVVVDIKSHTYNKYPDGHENNSLPYEVNFDIENGLVQTGISYPNSSNAKKSMAFAYENIDGSVIEFTGQEMDIPISDYNLKEVIVYDQ